MSWTPGTPPNAPELAGQGIRSVQSTANSGVVGWGASVGVGNGITFETDFVGGSCFGPGFFNISHYCAEGITAVSSYPETDAGVTNTIDAFGFQISQGGLFIVEFTLAFDNEANTGDTYGNGIQGQVTNSSGTPEPAFSVTLASYVIGPTGAAAGTCYGSAFSSDAAISVTTVQMCSLLPVPPNGYLVPAIYFNANTVQACIRPEATGYLNHFSIARVGGAVEQNALLHRPLESA